MKLSEYSKEDLIDEIERRKLEEIKPPDRVEITDERLAKFVKETDSLLSEYIRIRRESAIKAANDPNFQYDHIYSVVDGIDYNIRTAVYNLFYKDLGEWNTKVREWIKDNGAGR